MLKYGIISSIDHAKGLVKVSFEEDQIVSGWLQILFGFTKSDQAYYMPAEGSHVACLMDENLENGAVVGSVYDQTNQPAGGASGLFFAKFADGSSVEFDKNTGEMVIKAKGKVTVESDDDIVLKAGSGKKIDIDGDVTVTGKIEANGEITAKKTTTNVSLSTHVHVETGATTNAPTPGT